LGFPRTAGKAAVVVGQEDAQHGVGGVQIASLSQAQLAAQPILKDAPETFDAAFGLRTAGSNEGDAELFQRASELSGLMFSSELFLDRPEVVVADEDAAVIAVEGDGEHHGRARVGGAGRDSRQRIRRGRIERPGFFLWHRLADLEQVEFIVKDSKRFPDTHGGGYAMFDYDAASGKFAPATKASHPPVNDDAKCGAACHELAASKDYIFTAYPKR
jgi:hypothetical protein